MDHQPSRDRLLAPLSVSTGEASLEMLQAVERDGRALVAQRSNGWTCPYAIAASRAPGPSLLLLRSLNPAPLQPAGALNAVLCGSLCTAAECRTLLQCLTFQNPAFRAAMVTWTPKN